MYTLMPNGVGPMTVAELMRNAFKSSKMNSAVKAQSSFHPERVQVIIIYFIFDFAKLKNFFQQTIADS